MITREDLAAIGRRIEGAHGADADDLRRIIAELDVRLHDDDLAAGELMVEIPEPGSDACRLLRANRLLINARQDLMNERGDLLRKVDDLEAQVRTLEANYTAAKAGLELAGSRLRLLER